MAQCKNCFGYVGKQSECNECHSPLHEECAIKESNNIYCDVCYTVQEEKPKSKFGDFELPNQIRRTYIETYRTCPYKFYLEVIKGNVMPPNCYTQVGVDLHELFEEYIEGKLTEREVRNNYEEIWNNYEDVLFESQEQKKKMWERSANSLDTFFETIPSVMENPTFAVEENIEYSIGDNIPNVSITMDLITEKNGELLMHDWKTGRVMVGKKLSTDLQAPLYIYAVRQKYNKPVQSFTFYYLDENKTRTFVRSETDQDVYICTVGKREYKVNITDAIREVKSIFSHIKKGNFNIPSDTRKMYFPCKMCHLRAEGKCAGADEQSWINLN